jgi:hypothetical protein
LAELEIAARSLQVELQILEARAPKEFTGAFSAATKERAGALIVLGGVLFFDQRAHLAELAAKSRLPLVSSNREYAEVG